MRVWRGDDNGGEFADYVMPAVEGEVVLDVIHRIQADPAPDLACRWNCKAGKCEDRARSPRSTRPACAADVRMARMSQTAHHPRASR